VTSGDIIPRVKAEGWELANVGGRTINTNITSEVDVSPLSKCCLCYARCDASIQEWYCESIPHMPACASSYGKVPALAGQGAGQDAAATRMTCCETQQSRPAARRGSYGRARLKGRPMRRAAWAPATATLPRLEKCRIFLLRWLAGIL